MTDPSTGERVSTTGATTTSPTGSRRDAEQTGDPARGTEIERGHERRVREQRFQRATAMPADRHE